MVAEGGNDPPYADFQSAANPSQLPSHIAERTLGLDY